MSFIAFLVAATILAITPGPGIAYVVARTVAGGRSEGLASCMGTGLGGMLHVLAAAVGLSLLVAQSALAFTLVKYLGAAYLVFLGVRMLLRKQSLGRNRASVGPNGNKRRPHRKPHIVLGMMEKHRRHRPAVIHNHLEQHLHRIPANLPYDFIHPPPLILLVLRVRQRSQ